MRQTRVFQRVSMPVVSGLLDKVGLILAISNIEQGARFTPADRDAVANLPKISRNSRN